LSMLPVAVLWSFSDGTAILCSAIPVFWMTSYFHNMGLVDCTVVPEIYAYVQTDRHAHHNHPFPYWEGGVVLAVYYTIRGRNQ